MDRDRTHWNKNNITEYTLSSTEEQEAFFWSKDSTDIIQNLSKLINEQEAATFWLSENSIIYNAPTNKQETAIYHRSEDNNIIQNALDLSNKQKAAAVPQNETIQNTLKPINEGASTSHYSGVNIIQDALKSINEQRAFRPLSPSTSLLKCFDKANLAIDNKENKSIILNMSKLIFTLPEYSNINSTKRYTDDTFALNPLKRSKALSNFKDVDDSTVPYVLQKKQK